MKSMAMGRLIEEEVVFGLLEFYGYLATCH